MKKNETSKKFRWQPELATSMIYWSLTLGVFFLGLITLFESLRVTVLLVTCLAIFLLLVSLGQRRHFEISEAELHVHPILKKNKYVVQLESIKKISVGAYGLTFSVCGLEHLKEEERSFLMRRKTLLLFIAALEETSSFTGEIVSAKEVRNN